MNYLFQFFDSSGFIPHGHCYLWTPSLLWSYVVSDSIIAASYYSIPFALWYFAKKRDDLPYRWIFVVFGAFVMACGTTHMFAVWNIWHADYWVDAAVKALTAVVSGLTAIIFWRQMPLALAIPSRQLLEHLNLELRKEVIRRQQAEQVLQALNHKLEERVTERAAELKFKNTILTTQQETMLDGLLLVNDEQKILLFNRRFTELFQIPTELVNAREDEPVLRFVTGQVLNTEAFLSRIKHLNHHRSEDATDEIELKDGRTIERRSAPMVGSDGKYYGRIWYFRDITSRVITEAKLKRHTELYAALSQCNKAIVCCTSEEALFRKVCRAAVQFGGMKMAWIGLVDPETRMVRPVTSFGDGTDYLSSLKLSIDTDDLQGGGPTCIAIRESRPYWCQDLLNDPATSPWRELIQRADWAALSSLPLRRNGVVIGSFILYSDEINAFDELTRDLLTEMATDISFALDAFDRESQRKLAEEGLHEAEEQFRGLVDQSIVGIYIIQDEKFTYANPQIAEIAGLDSPDELIGSDPLSWIVEADRTEVARNMQRLLKNKVRSLALEFGILRRDGVEIRVEVNAARATQRGKLAIVGVAQDISEKKRAEEEIRNYIEQLRTTLNGTIEVVETISEMRDPYTAGHERRVAQIAVALAAELGLDEHQQEGLRVAGNLHDVGKIMIPAEILSKPSKLSPIEYALVQGHVQAGYEVLKKVVFPWPVAQVVLQHHERMDGSGYPQGLKGEAILFEARIMAVADVVEAMSSHRPYRPGLNIEAGLGEIERYRGAKYDPTVVDACLKLFRERGYKLPA